MIAPQLRLRAKSGKTLRGAIYARFSTRFQDSIADQVRACLAWAAANGVEVDEDVHVYHDRKRSGRTHKRPGLERLLAALQGDEVDVVITFATNRLFRKMYQSLRFAEEEIVSRRKRIILVAQGIDTAKTEFWRQLLSVYSMLGEMQVSSMAAFVRNAHIGLLDKELVHGTITFGYRGDVIPGEMTRRNKPKKKWAIDDDAAAWVRRVFDWYVSGELTFAAIVRRLNAERAPLPPRCQTGRWTELAVKALLGNRRYIGDFAYGRKEAVWQAKQGYVRQYAREKPLAERRIERLRIIDDAIFTAAQSRLSEHVGRGGRRPAGAANGEHAPHLLRGLLWCPRHQRFLGTYAHGWACLGCKKELRQLGTDALNSAGGLYSQVDPTLAIRLLCETIANLFEADEGFASMVREKFTAVVGQLQTPDPATVTRLQREHASWTTKINAIYDAPAEADKVEQHQRLAEFQRRRQEVQRQLNETD